MNYTEQFGHVAKHCAYAQTEGTTYATRLHSTAQLSTDFTAWITPVGAATLLAQSLLAPSFVCIFLFLSVSMFHTTGKSYKPTSLSEGVF